MPKLKVLNQSSDLDFGWEIAKELVEINKSFREKIDFTKLDKNHALFLTLGGLTTFVIRGLSNIEKGHAEELGQLHRLISESMDLALFLCESPDESRQIRAWFKGEIIERRPDNSGNMNTKERATLFNTDEKVIKNIDKDVEVSVRLLSKYFHPSYDMVTVAYDKSTESFRYYGKHLKVYTEDDIKTFVDLTVQPAITAFGMCMDCMFPDSNKDDALKGLEYLKKLSEFSRKLYPELYKK